MSKTVIAISEVAAGLALALTGFGVVALPWTLSAGALAAMGAIGVSAGITGVFGLLQPLLNPNDLSIPGSQQNLTESAAYRRTIYGAMEVGGVVTFDSAPAGSNAFQNQGPTKNWRHQIYTLASHQITSFGRNGVLCVVIDDVLVQLVLDSGGSGYYLAVDETMPYGGIDGAHAIFEFDLGNPASTSAFPNLANACPDWAGTCIQKGRAKVHVAMRYDTTADGTSLGNSGSTYTPNLQTSVPIFVNGRVPTFRFPVVGKPVIDTRTGLVAVNPSNPALCIYDYLTNTDYGLGVNPASIDIPSVNAAANICEEQVVVYVALA